MNDPIPELPLNPEDWRGSDMWAEQADIQRHINEERINEMYELMFDETL